MAYPEFIDFKTFNELPVDEDAYCSYCGHSAELHYGKSGDHCEDCPDNVCN